ncbi:phage portal protein [Microbacterium sp. SLBN-146]|nr:phage portal protein [Microbacterium sp. SLBN-146]
MGWLSDLFFGTGGGAAPLAAASGSLVPESQWYETNAQALVYRDHFGSKYGELQRTAAMKVAPIKRGRAIIVGSISDLPLSAGAWDGVTWVPANRQPVWLTRCSGTQTPWHRMATTVDDLIFYGWSLWALNRSEAGTILDAYALPQNRWSFDQSTPLGIRIDKTPVTDPRNVILFQGPDEGILATGNEAVQSWAALGLARLAKAQNPIPAMVLQETEAGKVTQAEAEQYVKAWGDRRRDPNGMIGFLPSKLSLAVHGDIKPELYDQAFNALRLDVANLLNLPASLLDGSTATASLTYVTQEGERQSLIDWLEYWLAPIEARLSMPDVTPQGQVVRFDRSNLTDVPNNSHGPELAADAAPEAA